MQRPRPDFFEQATEGFLLLAGVCMFLGCVGWLFASMALKRQIWKLGLVRLFLGGGDRRAAFHVPPGSDAAMATDAWLARTFRFVLPLLSIAGAAAAGHWLTTVG